MPTTKKKQTRKQKDHNGFAIPLQPDTELSLAMLIAEDEEGRTQPIAVASTINEAKELALNDFDCRLKKMQNDEDAGICPYEYKLWARGVEGEYIVAWKIETSKL